MVVALGQTVTVINKSGKVVSSSKHLVNIFKEAKSAYRERKAEIHAVHAADLDEKRARKALDGLTLDGDDRRSHASSSRASSTSRPHTHRSRSHRHHGDRPPMERGFSDSFDDGASDGSRRRPAPTPRRPSRLRFEQDVDAAADDDDHSTVRAREIVRRHSDGVPDLSRPKTERTASVPHVAVDAHDDIDMDLAYGELPPPVGAPSGHIAEEAELRQKMSGLTRLLDEANCLQHSVTSTIENLQKDPDALAAVALTLAEISNIIGKMGPGALMALKGTFPVVVALLASPQFMIAAGVGVGVTVVALGGYKIVKRIKQHRKDAADADGLEAPFAADGGGDELKEIPDDVDVSRIERWRRGIEPAEADSVSTTVDGEFVTPGAERRLIEEGVLLEGEAKSTRSRKTKKKHKVPKSPKTAKSAKSAKGGDTEKEKEKEKVKVKHKREHSGLRALFR